MRAPYTQLYLHLVWSIWDRLPLISEVVEAYIAAQKQRHAQRQTIDDLEQPIRHRDMRGDQSRHYGSKARLRGLTFH